MSKLVRDLIPEIIPQEKMGLYQFKKVGEEEYNQLLKKKLMEEAMEYTEAENIEELADLFEVIDAIIKLKKFDKNDILEVQRKKREERGGFENRLLMETVSSCTV